jgi:hypothetical protein
VAVALYVPAAAATARKPEAERGTR